MEIKNITDQEKQTIKKEGLLYVVENVWPKKLAKRSLIKALIYLVFTAGLLALVNFVVPAPGPGHMLIVGGFIPIPSFLIIAVLNVVLGCFALIGLRRLTFTLRQKGLMRKGLKKLEQDYGNIQASLKEIEDELLNTKTIKLEGGSILTPNWYIKTDDKFRFIKIADIAYITRTRMYGLNIVTSRDELVRSWGSSGIWGETIAEHNPTIIHYDDTIIGPNGTEVYLYYSFKAKKFGEIAEIFKKLGDKNSGYSIVKSESLSEIIESIKKGEVRDSE